MDVRALLKKAANIQVVDNYAAYQVYYRTVYLAQQKILELGAEAVSDLIEALTTSDDPKERQMAIGLLGKIGDSRAILPIRASRPHEDDPETHLMIDEALSRLHDEEHIAHLIARLNNPDATGRPEAVILLNKTRDAAYLPHLMGASHDADPAVREAATKALGYGFKDNPLVVPTILRALQDAVPSVRKTAIAVLIRNTTNDPRIVESLISTAHDPEPAIRLAGIKALLILEDERAVPVYIDALSDPAIAEYAVRGLYNFSPVEALPALVEYARQHELNGDIKWLLPTILGDSGEPEAILVLVQLIEKGDSQVQGAAFKAIIEISHPDAVGPLVGLLQHEDAGIRRGAVLALGRLGDMQAAGGLQALMDHDPDAGVQAAAVEALDILRERAAERTDFNALMEALAYAAKAQADAVKLTRLREIITDIGWLGDMRAVEALVALFQHNYPSIRRTAIQALLHLEARDAMSALRALMDDESISVRLMARYAVARLR